MSHSRDFRNNGKKKDQMAEEGKESFKSAKRLCANNSEAIQWLNTHRNLYRGPVTATPKAVKL